MERFRPTTQGNQCKRLVKLQQITYFYDYRRQFKRNATGPKDVCDDMLGGKFESGLKEEIQSEL